MECAWFTRKLPCTQGKPWRRRAYLEVDPDQGWLMAVWKISDLPLLEGHSEGFLSEALTSIKDKRTESNSDKIRKLQTLPSNCMCLRGTDEHIFEFIYF